MIRIGILVEGRTERLFIQDVLNRYLLSRGIHSTAVNLGGDIKVDRIVSRIVKVRRSFDYVTSLVDYYGFKNKKNANHEQLTKEIINGLKNTSLNKDEIRRIFPYIQMHEFEGLLFSEVAAVKQIPELSKVNISNLEKIKNQFLTPEDINDNKKTAPSKRILKLISKYNKRKHGIMWATIIGLDTIRMECHRFNSWLTQIETLEPAKKNN